jgi:peptide chain release factor subunit 3
LVEVDTTRDPASLVFIGHVDAGKSTICGNIMFNMGVVDERTIAKYMQEAKDKGRDSWWLAYVMDESDEEKAKGKTVEVGRALFNTETKRYTIFDAPGHKNYVPNMIMGAACADIGGLVISARKGEFEAGFDREGQTREHAQLAISLGISKLVVIVNKMDDPSVNWSKDRFDEIQDRIIPFLKECGYNTERDVLFCPISGLKGDNIKDRKTTADWWTGPTLIDTLDHMKFEDRDKDAPLRMPVLDKMRDRGAIVFGKVESGTLRHGDKLCLMPSNIQVQVVNIINLKDEAVPYALPGENIKVKLFGIDDDDLINRGDVLCPREPLMPASELIECELQVLELLEYKPILSKGYQCIMHLHTVSEDVTLKDIVVAYEKDDKGEVTEKKNPKFTRSGARIIARITTRVPVALEKFEQIPQLGKFTLRDQGKTIAIGKILKYKPAKVLDFQIYQEQQKQKMATEGGATGSEESKRQDVVFDMETGEIAEKKPEMAAIAEGEEDEDDN